jgi:hypothetical protein
MLTYHGRKSRVARYAKKYISETIDGPQAIYDFAIWDTPGFALVVSWLAQKNGNEGVKSSRLRAARTRSSTLTLSRSQRLWDWDLGRS